MTKDNFIDQIVFGWMKSDLENISRIRTAMPGEGNANLPLAMVTVMYMDHLGGYLLGTEKRGIEVNINEYLSCFKNPSDYRPELLCDLFRNGLGHDYFPRGGISRDNMRPPMVYSPGVGVILDVDSLFQDFIDSLDAFKVKLTEEKFEKRFSEAKSDIEKRYADHKSIIDTLPNPQTNVSVTPALMSSNASGTAVYSKESDNTGTT